jgi:cyclopropane-fatty-acyl-phospholipid synthase
MNERALTAKVSLEAEFLDSLPSAVLKVIDHPLALKRCKADGVLGLGESYIKGLWETPKLDDFMYSVFTSPGPHPGRQIIVRSILHVIREKLFDAQAGLGAFNIGRRHYDLGNNLFEAMLDKSMTYTCGYWKEADTLDEAQEAKLELICNKLSLEPGMHILDIGCGWGNFAHYAAETYGVRVTGITVSEEQATVAESRCQGLPVEIRLQDYRTVEGKFDHVVSIEMIEAVGRRNLPKYFSLIRRVLKDEGYFLLQAISTDTCSFTSDKRVDQFLFWILKYIFPDGYLPKAEELVYPAKTGFLIEDLENLGPHYDPTLCAWARNFNDSWDDLKDSFDEEFRRCWKFYLYSCAALFRAGLVQLYQILYSKSGSKV